MEQENQHGSVESFFRKEYRNLVSYAGRRIDDRFGDESPEDIVQEVMLSLLERLDPGKPIADLAAYVWRSVKYRVIDAMRKKRRTVPASHLEPSAVEKAFAGIQPAAPDEPPLYSAVSPEQLQAAILRLKPAEQELVTATVYGQRTFEELSREWDVPIGTLLSRKHRALEKMQRMLIPK